MNEIFSWFGFRHFYTVSVKKEPLFRLFSHRLASQAMEQVYSKGPRADEAQHWSNDSVIYAHNTEMVQML